MSSLYPWQTTQWEQVIKQHGEGKLPHALLLLGAQGLGKTHFARELTHYVLCSQPKNNQACGACKSCELNRAVTHPDVLWLEPEEIGKQIKIDQIRSVSEFANQTAQQGGYRVVVITPAEAMNQSSANALLKNLEEPGVKTLFLLVTHTLSRVSATIRSRCQRIGFVEPDEAVAIQWLTQTVSDKHQAQTLLQLANGAPLRALRFLEVEALEQREIMIDSLINLSNEKSSVVEVAAKWGEGDTGTTLTWLSQWLAEAIKARCNNKNSIKNKELEAVYKVLAAVINQRAIYEYMDKVNLARKDLMSTANPNKQLMLEELLVGWCSLINLR